MVGIRVVESGNWGKEENATKPKKLGKNFLVKTTNCALYEWTKHELRSGNHVYPLLKRQ
jgi:hypothetical protein